MTPDNLARARKWISHALDTDNRIRGNVWLRLMPSDIDVLADALAAAVRAKGIQDGTLEIPGVDGGDETIGNLREAIRDHAADVPEVPETAIDPSDQGPGVFNRTPEW